MEGSGQERARVLRCRLPPAIYGGEMRAPACPPALPEGRPGHGLRLCVELSETRTAGGRPGPHPVRSAPATAQALGRRNHLEIDCYEIGALSIHHHRELEFAALPARMPGEHLHGEYKSRF